MQLLLKEFETWKRQNLHHVILISFWFLQISALRSIPLLTFSLQACGALLTFSLQASGGAVTFIADFSEQHQKYQNKGSKRHKKHNDQQSRLDAVWSLCVLFFPPRDCLVLVIIMCRGERKDGSVLFVCHHSFQLHWFFWLEIFIAWICNAYPTACLQIELSAWWSFFNRHRYFHMQFRSNADDSKSIHHSCNNRNQKRTSVRAKWKWVCLVTIIVLSKKLLSLPLYCVGLHVKHLVNYQLKLSR